jgi:hypothetical protein
MRCHWVSATRWVLLMAVLSALLGLGLVAVRASNQGEPPGLRQLKARDPTLLDIDYPMADLSLAAREQVDFLLTPALLVQEAASEDVILTYPEE